MILWSLNSSEAVSALLKESYKHRKNNDDAAVPLYVPRWGRDGEKRQYWLIEGQQDTSFRVYRESNPAQKKKTWWSVAGDLDELRSLVEKLESDESQYSRQLGARFKSSIPRFLVGDEVSASRLPQVGCIGSPANIVKKRKRREYRQQRKAQFQRPEPGFSLYEGRTRGKRLKYTYSDDEADTSDATSTRRSTRVATPADPSKPIVTASGRQVRSRIGGAYGERMHSGQITNQPTPAEGEYDGSELSDARARQRGRTTRSGGPHQANGWSEERKHIAGYNELDEMDDEDDAMSSGGEWDGGDDDDDVDDRLDDQEEDGEVSSDEEDDLEPKSLVVKLRYPKGAIDGIQHQNGHKATNPSIAPNGTSASFSTNGYQDGLDDQDSDTIVVRQQPPLVHTARPVEGTGKPTSQSTVPSSNLTTSVHSSSLPIQQPPAFPSISMVDPNPGKAVPTNSLPDTHSAHAATLRQDTADPIQGQSNSRTGFTAPGAATTATPLQHPVSSTPSTGIISSIPPPSSYGVASDPPTSDARQ